MPYFTNEKCMLSNSCSTDTGKKITYDLVWIPRRFSLSQGSSTLGNNTEVIYLRSSYPPPTKNNKNYRSRNQKVLSREWVEMETNNQPSASSTPPSAHGKRLFVRDRRYLRDAEFGHDRVVCPQERRRTEAFLNCLTPALSETPLAVYLLSFNYRPVEDS